MQEIEVNIKQQEKIIINDNKTLESKKTTERNINTGLRDNFITEENKQNKDIERQKKEKAIKLIKDLQELIKKNEELKKKKSKEECTQLCCLFFRLIFILIIFFSLHFIFLGEFIYYNKNCKYAKL